MSMMTALLILGLLVHVSPSFATGNGLAEEVSVPEPTELHIVVSTGDSELVWSEYIGEIMSDQATASVSVIEVEGPNDKQVRGVLIVLLDASSEDEIYVTDTLLPGLRKELQQLEYTRQFDIECQSRNRCIHGIARCRPSQTERQAYCPGRYSTKDSEEGFILSTLTKTFWFPSVEAAQFDLLISQAIQALD